MDKSAYDRFQGDGVEDDNWDDLTIEEQFEAADECPECEGLGLVPVGFDDDPDVYENIEGTCYRCNGDGKYHKPVDAAS